eukprot:6487042-Amphidinium_carterae.1
MATRFEPDDRNCSKGKKGKAAGKGHSGKAGKDSPARFILTWRQATCHCACPRILHPTRYFLKNGTVVYSDFTPSTLEQI